MVNPTIAAAILIPSSYWRGKSWAPEEFQIGF